MAGSVSKEVNDVQRVGEPKAPPTLLTAPKAPYSTGVPSSSLPVTSMSVIAAEAETSPKKTHPERKLIGIRRFSFRAFSFTQTHNQAHDDKPTLTALRKYELQTHTAPALSKFVIGRSSPNSDKRALESALIVRTFIVGPSGVSPQLTSVPKSQLRKVESQLRQPKSANKLIAQLRALPMEDTMASEKENNEGVHSRKMQGPIHAVCLEHPDAEMHDIHFASLLEGDDDDVRSLALPGASSISLNKLTTLFDKMKIINLIKSPDLGLGQPGDGPGLLSGAVPTAETVISGITLITPQLMALGYATGNAILPDHTGIYPPTDRISVLTYWWGLELVLPPPSLNNLTHAQSIAGTIVNLLTALSLINDGVREILPFIRYIAQFVDFEFNAIKAQNRGRGVVCAATWIMPAAMVPRPWDFPDPPRKTQPSKVAKLEVENLPPHQLPASHPTDSSPAVDPLLK